MDGSDPPNRSERVQQIQGLRQREADFRAAAQQRASLRCAMSLLTEESGPCPGLRYVDLPGGRMLEMGLETLPFRESAGWTAGWRVGMEKGRQGYGIPPQTYENGVKFTNLQSVWPKPWGFFWPDNPDLEKGWVQFAGDAVAFDRYKSFATATLEQLAGVKLPKPIAAVIELASVMVEETQPHLRWTLLIFTFIWEGLAPSPLTAPREMWAGEAIIDSSLRNALLRDRDHPVLAELPRDVIIPKDWRHFFAILSPDLHLASAEMLGEIIRLMEADAAHFGRIPQVRNLWQRMQIGLDLICRELRRGAAASPKLVLELAMESQTIFTIPIESHLPGKLANNPKARAHCQEVTTLLGGILRAARSNTIRERASGRLKVANELCDWIEGDLRHLYADQWVENPPLAEMAATDAAAFGPADPKERLSPEMLKLLTFLADKPEFPVEKLPKDVRDPDLLAVCEHEELVDLVVYVNASIGVLQRDGSLVDNAFFQLVPRAHGGLDGSVHAAFAASAKREDPSMRLHVRLSQQGGVSLARQRLVHTPRREAAPQPDKPPVDRRLWPRRAELMAAAKMGDQTRLAIIKAAGLYKGLQGIEARDERFAPDAVLKLRRTALEGTYIRRVYSYWGWEKWSDVDPHASLAPPKPDDLEPIG